MAFFPLQEEIWEVKRQGRGGWITEKGLKRRGRDENLEGVKISADRS